MALKEYQKKRKFDKTPEPAGKTHKNPAQLHFVVQKHKASHLHYDFRLEMAGVLKSWAIPKGPSINPKDKRLAIMVEDHPYDYKDFEGIIPKGNYGAGEVIIWDEGTYEPMDTTDLDLEKKLLEELKKGQIKFILHGHKLRGQFTLLKLADIKNNSWLLIKKTDAYAEPTDILKQDQSIRSGRRVDQLGQAGPIMPPPEAPTTPMPTVIQPMLAQLCAQPFDRKGWIFEIKWDGFRILAYLNGKKVKLLSRHQKNYTKIFSPVSEELANSGLTAILDGEMVVLDKEGRAQFQLLQQFQKSGEGQLIYYVFDLLWLNGKDLRGLPLEKRKQLLQQILPPLYTTRISDYIEKKGKAFFKLALAHHLEGIMAKNIASTYQENHRSNNWLKIKTKQRQEVVIGGYTTPRGARYGFGALVLGIYQGKDLIYVGHTGSGFNEVDLHELKSRLDKLIQTKSPFKDPPTTNFPVTWVKPKLICEVSFSEWTREGHLRHPIFQGLREDKSPIVVVHEQAKPPPNTIEEKNCIEKTILINRHRIHLTHLNKIFWPKEGYKKNDVIEYYQKIANFILPYLKNRPESLNRHPNGINGDSFFQKNFTIAPKWIKTVPLFSKSENHDIHYIICQNESTLVYMANLGCIEINPWLSRYQTPDHPDFCVLDLDPEKISFSAVVQTAQTIHHLLDKISATHFCKTSGATGLHIFIPLKAKYSYAQSQSFAELIANLVHSQLPNITSIVRSPNKRQKKVYIDFLQNRKGQTIVAPYSLRPRPEAPVSTPLQWKEVNLRLNPVKFNISTIHKRLEKIGDIWQSILDEGIDLNACLDKLQTILKKRK